MNYKLLIVISFILVVLSLASASASDVDQTALHDARLDNHIDYSLHDTAIADGLAIDSSSDDSKDMDNYNPDSPIDDGSGSADAVDDGSADIDDKVIPVDDGSADIDDKVIPVDDGSADDKVIPAHDDSNIPIDSDITDDDSIISNITNDTVKPKYNDKPISNIKESAGSFEELQSLIDIMLPGTTIVLARDYRGAEGKQVVINKNLCIDGNGHTIDCAGVCRALYSSSGGIVLKNLRIINGHYETSASDDKTNNGGAIWIGGTATYTIINCEFVKNWADDMGGAIYNDANNLLKIINCTFDSNEVDDVDGGAIYSKGEIYVENSIFKGNKAYQDGGAIHLEKRDASALSKIINSIFTSNTVKKYHGGAVCCHHCLFIDMSTFTANGGSAKDGGAVSCAENFIVQNSLFQGNNAEMSGGALDAYRDASISNCTFISNKVDGTMSYAKGGAIYSGGDLYIDNCTFDKNWADDMGGAISTYGSLFINYFQADDGIYNTFFNENTADDNYAGAIECTGIAYIKNAKFFANRAYTDGGAIYAKADAYITHCLFDSNRCYDASSYCQGGAIYGEKTLNIMDCIFKDNYAEDDGGAIYCDDTVNIDNSTFKENSAEDYGGAIYAKTVNINKLNEACKSFFINNHAKDDKGGAIYASDSVYAYNAEFSDNSALVDGGAIWANNVNVNKCSFDSNRAEGAKSTKCYGGAIRAGAAKVYDCVFNNNFAENHGGAIFTDTFSDAVKYCTFNKNQAKEDGGAVYINNENSVTFTQCIFSNNKAGDEGGAIYLDSTSSTIRILNNLFDGNSASDGHAVFNKGSYGEIRNNWWGDKNPTSSNNMLVEWCFWTSNINHVDSDPLKLEFSCSRYLTVGQLERAILHFVKSDGSVFAGEIPMVMNLSLPNEYALVYSGSNSYSIYMDFIPTKEGYYSLTAKLLNQVLYFTSIVSQPDDLKINEINACDISPSNSSIVKNVMASDPLSKFSSDLRSNGLKVLSPNFSLNAHPVLGQSEDQGEVVIDKSIFNPAKTMDIHGSNGDFSIFSILLSILAIFGF